MDKYYNYLKQSQDKINKIIKEYNYYKKELSSKVINYEDCSYYKYFKSELDFWNNLNKRLANIIANTDTDAKDK